MYDRVPTKPGRMKITPEDGSTPFFATVEMADEPSVVGTPLNKATFLSDETAALFGLGAEAVPDDVLQSIVSGNWYSFVHTGTVLWFASATAPDGFLACDGSAISRTTYARLFAVVGATFGAGDGNTTFNIPNLINNFIKGSRSPGAKSEGSYIQEYTAEGDRATINQIVYNPISQSSIIVSKRDISTSATTTQKSVSNFYVQPPNVTLLPCIKY